MAIEQKKRHHYVPQVYLQHFTAPDGKLLVYRKDEPVKPYRVTPENAGLRRYYYSQPKEDGEWDNNVLEDHFSTVEDKWPDVMRRVMAREDLSECIEALYMFVALQRVRVPAARDMHEFMRADSVMALARQLQAAGKLPPTPPGHEDLLDKLQVSIDPHTSIRAIPDALKAVGLVLDLLGLHVIENETAVPFLTSDNPVIWYDPSLPEGVRQPYRVDPRGHIELCFPLSPTRLLYGSTGMRDTYREKGVTYSRVTTARVVKGINRSICRFGYEAVYAREPGQEAVIVAHAGTSPVVQTNTVPSIRGAYIFSGMVFGKRRSKARWDEDAP